jgi:predicted dinucleotide-binding enzyme
MTIGIIGADDRAVAIGRMLQRCGHKVSFSSPKGNDAADKAAQALGGDASSCTTYDQAATSEALVMAIHWEDVDDTLKALGDYKDGLVIDATRPPELGAETSGAEILAKKLDNRHVVKAFVDVADPKEPIRIASDDPEARMQVEEMIRTCGGVVEDAGPLSKAAEIERESAARHPVG